MSLSSKIIPGTAHNQNRGACHWGNQGFIAYGCQQYVVVVDPSTLQTIQVVNKHTSNVVCVRWNNEDYHHDIVHPYSLTVASGDTGGSVCVWNVVTGDTKMEFREKNKSVKDICWLTNKDTGDSALLVLYSGGTLALWDCTSTSQLWRTAFAENMTTITIDPFKPSTAAFLADDSIVIIEDLKWNESPGKTASKISFSGKNAGTAQIRRNSSSLNKLITTLISGESKPSRKSLSEEQDGTSQCLHITYHPNNRHWLLMVFPDHVDIVDVDVSIVIGTVKLDSNASPFVRVIPCRQRDVLICLHENSSITIRLRREDTSHCSYDANFISTSPLTPESPGGNDPTLMIRDIVYDMVWQSDTMRLSSSSTVFGYEVHPVLESQACLVCNDGKIVIWELISVKLPYRNTVKPPAMALSDYVPASLRRGTRNKVTRHVKFLQTGVCRGSSHNITAMRANVLDTLDFSTENQKQEKNLLALGDEEGSIHIVDLQSGQLDKEYSVHFDVVRGIEWVNQSLLLSWSHQQSSHSTSHGKNEIILLSLKSGKIEKFREQKTVDSLIHIIKISPLRQYVIISFKDSPIEIWSLKTGTIVRELPPSTMQPRAIVRIYPSKLEVKATTETNYSASYLDIMLSYDIEGHMKTSLYDKRDDFNFNITNFPFLSSNFPSSPAYGAFIFQLLRYIIANTSYPDSVLRARCFSDKVWSTMSTWRTVKKHLDMKLSQIQSMEENEDSIKKLSQEEISSMMKNIQLKKIAKEQCLLADKDGMICRLTLEDRSITDIVMYPAEINGMTILTHMAMQADYLLISDASSMLSVLNLTSKQTKTLTKADKSGPHIRKLSFNPNCTDNRFFVLYDNAVETWSINDDKVKLVGNIRISKDMKKILDADWADAKHLAMITQDGAIHIREYKDTNVRHTMNGRHLKEAIFCPHSNSLSSRRIPLMKHVLQHMSSMKSVKLAPDQTLLQDSINEQIQLINREILTFMKSPKSSMVEKCIITSRLFGDQFDLKFWNLASACINNWKESKNETADSLISLDSNDDTLQVPGVKKSSTCTQCTGSDFDVLMQQKCFWNNQLHRHRLHDKKRTTPEHRSVCVDNYILLGQIEDAVRLLLETNFQEEGYREDYLRACLLSCDRNNTTGQSTLKLVATHLIISGKLNEGLGILCLMDKVIDGCKYLQSYNEWEKAAWLSKAVLKPSESSEIFNKWIDFLIQSKNMVDAVFVMLSEKRFYDVAKNLLHIGFLDTAACFVEACTESGIDLYQDDTDNTIQDFLPTYEKHLERLGFENIQNV